MENSLLKSLLPLLSSCNNLHQGAIQCADASSSFKGELFPFQVSGAKGSINGFFLQQFIERISLNEVHAMQYEQKHSQWQKDYVIVVSTHKDALECKSDLNTIFADKADVFILPWWGTIPYRSVSVGSAVFGERAGVLAKMANRNPSGSRTRIFILTQ